MNDEVAEEVVQQLLNLSNLAKMERSDYTSDDREHYIRSIVRLFELLHDYPKTTVEVFTLCLLRDGKFRKFPYRKATVAPMFFMMSMLAMSETPYAHRFLGEKFELMYEALWEEFSESRVKQKRYKPSQEEVDARMKEINDDVRLLMALASVFEQVRLVVDGFEGYDEETS